MIPSGKCVAPLKSIYGEATLEFVSGGDHVGLWTPSRWLNWRGTKSRIRRLQVRRRSCPDGTHFHFRTAECQLAVTDGSRAVVVLLSVAGAYQTAKLSSVARHGQEYVSPDDVVTVPLGALKQDGSAPEGRSPLCAGDRYGYRD